MIDIDKKYQTRCGYPVRNLHWDMFAIDGEYYFKGEWHLGSWLDNGHPAIFTIDRELILSLSLVEVEQESMIIVQKQLELNLID